MNSILTYALIFVILLAIELVYFMVADKCNIIDRPNERSSHSSIVLRGDGVAKVIKDLCENCDFIFANRLKKSFF